ncbi:MAG TPA: VCBS repeat-containing protein, partial [Flavitalea sp.]|nr:VCBS repeat-containing protein [Flavitalea sp.]
IRKRSLAYEASNLSSAILWNDGGKFSFESLPVEAQVSPVFGILADDFNGDGKMDIWLGGNFYALKPQVGRHDASRGVLLAGDGKRSFTYVMHCGIFVRGEVRDAVIIPFKGTKRIFIARNNAGVKAYEYRVNSEK